MGATGVTWERRRWFRRLRSGAPPSPHAALFLAVSAFLCGAVVAGLLFVGIWRHTAGEQARTEAARQQDRQQLLATRRTVESLRRQVAQTRILLARARRDAAREAAAIAHARTLDRELRASIAQKLQELVQTGSALTSQATTIESELDALRSYTRHPGAAGLDAGYLTSQVDYLLRSAGTTASTAASLVRAGREAQAWTSSPGQVSESR